MRYSSRELQNNIFLVINH